MDTIATAEPDFFSITYYASTTVTHDVELAAVPGASRHLIIESNRLAPTWSSRRWRSVAPGSAQHRVNVAGQVARQRRCAASARSAPSTSAAGAGSQLEAGGACERRDWLWTLAAGKRFSLVSTYLAT
ncbi:MAG: hypothetical protein J0I40_09190, partial [Cellulomonas sp.]|nr:hypothetical protein [Cellulomonas sp.]